MIDYLATPEFWHDYNLMSMFVTYGQLEDEFNIAPLNAPESLMS